MDQVGIQDQINIVTAKAVEIFCYRCGQLFGHIKSNSKEIDLSNVSAVNKDVGWICPSCRSDIRAWLGDTAAIKTSKGVMQC